MHETKGKMKVKASNMENYSIAKTNTKILFSGKAVRATTVTRLYRSITLTENRKSRSKTTMNE